MALKVEHELHRRRLGRNLGLGLVLGGFVAVVFGLTVVKVENEGAQRIAAKAAIPAPAAIPAAEAGQ